MVGHENENRPAKTGKTERPADVVREVDPTGRESQIIWRLLGVHMHGDGDFELGSGPAIWGGW